MTAALTTAAWAMAAMGADATPFAGPAPELSAFAAPAVLFAAQAWPLRAAEEDRSEMVFQRIRSLSAKLELHGALQARIDSAARDEDAHRRLCARVGRALGAPAPRWDRTGVELRFAGLPAEPRRQLLSLVTIEVAMGETISCGLFRAGTEGSTEPLTHWALQSILRDEARHAQVGWDCVKALLEGASSAERAGLREELPGALCSMEQTTAIPALRRLERGERFDETLQDLGVLAPEVRVDAFYEAVERRVLPRLDALGLDGSDAWARRYPSLKRRFTLFSPTNHSAS